MFQFIRGIRKKSKAVDPIEFLTYAAIGTIADMSPVIGDNRIIVKHGLGSYALNSIRASGLKALMGVVNLKSDFLTQSDISFKIAPRLNAAGRMEKPDLAFHMLKEYDVVIAGELAARLDFINSERKRVQNFMESEAMKLIKDMDCSNGVLIKNAYWSIGVAGILAS
jgi:single-stranded-DNA-specific exonuclease